MRKKTVKRIKNMTPNELLKENELQYVDIDIQKAFRDLGLINYPPGQPTRIQLNRNIKELSFQLKEMNEKKNSKKD